MYKRKNKISEKSKERIYRSISMKRKKRMSISLESRTINDDPSQKKKERNVQEEPIKLSKTNIHSLTPFVSPLGNLSGFLIISSVRSKVPSPLTRSRINEEFLSLYIYISIPKLNHSIDPIVVISLEVPPLVPPPPSSTEPSNDCKDPGPSAEGRADSSARSPSWSSPSCSETRSWFAPRSGPDPSRAAASSAPSGIDSPRTPSSAWPVAPR